MYVRLAFSIATSVNPDILIIDEALAVGDQRFQKKCVDRMVGFRESGKTILFCSHSMYLVQTLCKRAIWLDKGRIRMSGSAEEVTRAYEDWSMEKGKQYEKETRELIQTQSLPPPCRILSVTMTDLEGNPIKEISQPFQTVKLSMELKAQEDLPVHLGFAILRADELLCFCSITSFDGLQPIQLKKNEQKRAILELKDLNLADGSYKIMGGIADEHGLHVHHALCAPPFLVRYKAKEGIGVMTLPRKWSFE